RRPPGRPSVFPYTTLFRSEANAFHFGRNAVTARLPFLSKRGGFVLRSCQHAPISVVILPILLPRVATSKVCPVVVERLPQCATIDRKSTRLNSSHVKRSYA